MKSRHFAILFATQYIVEKCASFQPLPLTQPLRGRTSASSGSALNLARNANPKVLYQKVLRPSGDNRVFLPSLIDYIQTQFQVPKDLPMIYSSTVPDDVSGETSYSILELDSPLSRTPDLTRMEVEVVGVYTDNDNEEGANLPSMAMVVVKKMDIHDTRDMIMKRMFDDSESKIIRSLEKDLDDLMDGKIDFDVGKNKNAKVEEMATGEWSGLEALDDYEGFESKDGIMEDLMVASTGRQIDNTKRSLEKHDDGILDAIFTDVDSPSVTDKITADSVQEEKTDDTEPAEIEDFAVKAARISALKQKMMKDKAKVAAGGDFAVEAAKAAAKARDTKAKETKRTEKYSHSTDVKEINAVSAKNVGQGASMELPTKGKSPMLENLSLRGKSSFQVKISSPDTFKKRSSVFERGIANEKEGKQPDEKKDTQRKINMVVDRSMETPSVPVSENERLKELDNIGSQEVLRKESVPKVKIEDGKITKSDEEIEQDILRAALNIMPGSVDEDDSKMEMSAEELLEDILKFGDEKEKETSEGSGFVKGAFSKAKELTTESTKVGVRERSDTKNIIENIKFEDETVSLSAEDELKQIFAAGESIAEGRITQSLGPKGNVATNMNTSDSTVTEEYIDELIEADKTVPGNARTLDEELAELELRISKTPGEDTEAYGNNALFDVFSGPEVYNPNVDPLTSVNFPGAQPGTRTDVRLPPQLSEAVKSAQFASKLLSKIVEEEQDDETKEFYIDGKKISSGQVQRLHRAVDEGVSIGLIEDPMQYLKERARLKMLTNELGNQPAERFDEISAFYKDLLLSDNFVLLLKESLREMASTHLEMQRSGEDPTELEEKHCTERNILGKLVKYSQLLLKEVQALGAELEVTQVEVIRSICKVAMNPDHKTEEETSDALKDAVRDMKPLLDESFVAYLKYAISEEEGRLARAGVLDDPEHNRWLFVLKIVQEGVYAELAIGVQRYIDHIGYVLRMETKKERRQLLSKIIDVMPSMDVRPFLKVVDNIAASLGQGRKGEFDVAVLGGMANKILQLRRDVHELLPPERIKVMSKEADEWVARQRKQLLEQRGVSQQRLKSARETESYDEEIGRRGEVERFT